MPAGERRPERLWRTSTMTLYPIRIGCNMAFRRACLEALDGFDPLFRIAGDDVDLCWRLQERGWSLRFHPGALVWHHRRATIKDYWRQQLNYGRAEAMLERKWPEKYN